jgi:S1-C subfamily serine protease
MEALQMIKTLNLVAILLLSCTLQASAAGNVWSDSLPGKALGALMQNVNGFQITPAHHIGGSIATDTNPQMAHLIETVKPAVVKVVVPKTAKGQGFGSGFIVHPEGLVVTNAHVVGQAPIVEMKFADGRIVFAKVVAVNEKRDLALAWLDQSHANSEAGSWPTVEVADPDSAGEGHVVVAIGSPFGMDFTITMGHVSALNRDIGDPVSYVQTDASVNPGNSGGPLFDISGKVVGVNSKIYSQARENNGLAFAIPAKDLQSTILQYSETGNIDSGQLGVALGAGLDFGRPRGAKITGVGPGSPAAKAGLQAEDLVLSIDGIELPTDANEAIAKIVRITAGHRPKDVIVLKIKRGGEEQEISVTLGSAADANTAGKGGGGPQGAPQGEEGSTKGNLGAIRSALSIYYGDTEGQYPENLEALLEGGKYLTGIPEVNLGADSEHAPTNAVRIITEVANSEDLERQIKEGETGGWLYVADPDSPAHGSLFVDCSHADSKGQPWYKY